MRFLVMASWEENPAGRPLDEWKCAERWKRKALAGERCRGVDGGDLRKYVEIDKHKTTTPTSFAPHVRVKVIRIDS